MKKILILSGLSLLVALAVRAQDKVTEYNVRPAIVVRTPIQGDSINFTGEKFTADKLLKTDIDLDFDGRSYERVPVDTAGYVRVPQDMYGWRKQIRIICSICLPPICVRNAL